MLGLPYLRVSAAVPADEVFLWPQDGATMLDLTFSADALCSTRVGVGHTRLSWTVSATEILRSVQRGGGTMLSLVGLALVSGYLLSKLLVFTLSGESSRLPGSVQGSS